MRLERCLTILNSRSSNAMAAANVDALLKLHLDGKGIDSNHVRVPPESIDAVFKGHAASPHDLTIVTGGDGTVSGVVNSMMTHWAQEGRNPEGIRPIAVVPTGLQNSMATTVGLRNAEATLTAILSLRMRRLPLWRVSLQLGGDGEVYERWMLGSLSAGTFEHVVSTATFFTEVSREFTHWPMIRRKFNYASLNAAAWNRSCPISAKLHKTGDDVPTELGTDLRMVLASALPIQYGRYSLTPNVRMGKNHLGVCCATQEATRSRMFHLLRREALQGEILNEDGVSLYGPEIDSLELAPTAGNAVDVRLDGELLTLPPGSKLLMKKSEFSVPIVVA